MLIQAGADVNHASHDGNTALMNAINNSRNFDAIYEFEYCDMVKLLIEHGADVNRINNKGNTALMFAARKNNIGTVILLLERGANVNYADRYGQTALMAASHYGYTGIVTRLIESGADVNHVNIIGDAAIIRAAKNGCTDIIRILVEHGAIPPSEEHLQERQRYLNLHPDQGSQAELQRIRKTLEAVFEDNALAYAAARGDRQHVSELLRTIPGLDINHQDAGGMTALNWAAVQGHPDIVGDLLRHGADFRLRDAWGLLPYRLAERNRSEMTAAGGVARAEHYQQVMDTMRSYIARGTAEMTLERAFKQLTKKGQDTGTAPEEMIQMIMRQNIPQPMPHGGR